MGLENCGREGRLGRTNKGAKDIEKGKQMKRERKKSNMDGCKVGSEAGRRNQVKRPEMRVDG